MANIYLNDIYLWEEKNASGSLKIKIGTYNLTLTLAKITSAT